MKYLLIAILTLLIFLPTLTLAAATSNPTQGFSNPVTSLRNKTFQSLVGGIIAKILGMLGIIALLLFIYAGFLWMSAQGKSEQITKARGIMLWVTIGLLIIFSSYALLSFIFGIF